MGNKKRHSLEKMHNVFYFSLLVLESLIHASFPGREYYKVITPILISTEEDGELIIQLSEYILHLENQMLPPIFTNIYFKESNPVIETDFAGCIYKGEVEDFPQWPVSLTLCNGVHGHFGDKENYYQIEPLDANSNDNVIEQPHLFYSHSESYQEPSNETLGMCVTETFFHRRMTRKLFSRKKGRPEPMASQVYEEDQRIVELVLVNDYSQYLRFSKRLPLVVLRDVEIVERMNELYSSLNISIALVGVVTWTEKDLIAIPDDTDPVTVLVNFKDYFYRIPGHLDCAILISGRDFKESVVGLAYKGAICYGRFSVGIVQDARISVLAVGGTATHEMGHILGMSHDEAEGRVCECNDPTGKCIMAAVSPVTPSTVWSNCSLPDVENNNILNPVSETCLYNEPSPNFTQFIDTGSRGSTSKTSSVTTVFVGLLIIITVICNTHK